MATEVEDANRGNVDELDVRKVNEDSASGQSEQRRQRIGQQQGSGHFYVAVQDESGR